MKYFLTIAASDNCGGAGIQQDLRIAERLGYWGLSAITGITVQSFKKLYLTEPVNAGLLKEQMLLNLNTFDVKAFKIGAICSEENIKIISQLLIKYKPKNIVLDTVFAPTKGKAFISHKSVYSFRELLLPYVDIITPNKDELSLLTGKKISTLEHGIKAATQIANEYGCKIYIKGGHFNNRSQKSEVRSQKSDNKRIEEALIYKDKVFYFEKDKLNLTYSHGTGCAFSTALSCYLGNGLSINNACKKASEFISNIYKVLNYD